MTEEIWRIELFGGLRLRRAGGTPLDRGNHQVDALIARLAFFRGQALSRTELAQWLIADSSDLGTKRERLKQALFQARRILEPEGVPARSVVIADRDNIRLDSDAVLTDVALFETGLKSAANAPSLVERAAILSEAAELYGPLLPGFEGNWTREREQLAAKFFGALDQFVTALAETDGPKEAIHRAGNVIRCACEAVVREKSSRQAWHCAVLRLCLAAGWADEGLEVYAHLTEPSPEVRELARILRDLKEGGARTALVDDPDLPVPRRPVNPIHPRSRFYVVRQPAEARFQEAIKRRDSIILVKGPRQIGKTSLLWRWLDPAPTTGVQAIWTDFDRFSDEQMRSAESLFRALAEDTAESLRLNLNWSADRGWNVNFERFLRRELLGRATGPVVWVMDKIDRLFFQSCRSEVFGVFRSWHSPQATGLTLVLAHAEEPHLSITNPNQSPFNVATWITLEDFTRDQVEALNRRYASPLRDRAEVTRFFDWLGGVPCLVHDGLHAMAYRGCSLEQILDATAEEPFGAHLRGLFHSRCRDPQWAPILRGVLRGEDCPTEEGFYRLRSAGVLAGKSAQNARFRCALYQKYVKGHLTGAERIEPDTPRR